MITQQSWAALLAPKSVLCFWWVSLFFKSTKLFWLRKLGLVSAMKWSGCREQCSPLLPTTTSPHYLQQLGELDWLRAIESGRAGPALSSTVRLALEWGWGVTGEQAIRVRAPKAVLVSPLL